MKKQIIIISVIILIIALGSIYYFFMRPASISNDFKFHQSFESNMVISDLEIGEYISAFVKKDGETITADRLMVCDSADACTMRKNNNRQTPPDNNRQDLVGSQKNSNMTIISGSLVSVDSNMIILKIDSGEEQKVSFDDSVLIFKN